MNTVDVRVKCICITVNAFLLLKSHKLTDDEFSGVVPVTIRYRDELRNLDLNDQDVPIKLRCGGKPGHGWKRLSVEYL